MIKSCFSYLHFYSLFCARRSIFIPDLPILMFYPPIKHFSYWLPFPLGYFISNNNIMQKTLFPCQIVLEDWSKMSWKSWKCPGIPVGKKSGHPVLTSSSDCRLLAHLRCLPSLEETTLWTIPLLNERLLTLRK